MLVNTFFVHTYIHMLTYIVNLIPLRKTKQNAVSAIVICTYIQYVYAHVNVRYMYSLYSKKKYNFSGILLPAIIQNCASYKCVYVCTCVRKVWFYIPTVVHMYEHISMYICM